ncbi:DEAD/DEAH box helicase [bacterium]|nr:DEAD/DEAH box helicase [bacterium]
MKAFSFDTKLVKSYENFTRSFSTIHSKDLYDQIDGEYSNGWFWPNPLLSLNPRFLSGPSVDELVTSEILDEGTGKVFRFGEGTLRFHRHQAEAIAKAKSGKSFVVTTGTGSGKSLCFFAPVVDVIIRALREGKPRKTRAIIVYPMNALARRLSRK